MLIHEKVSHRWCGLPQFLALLMAVTPVFADGQASQSASQPAAPSANQPAQAPQPVALPTIVGLKVVPLAGKGETNDLERKLMAPLVVEVIDQQDRPVENAEVVFRFPIQGASATFPGGKTTQTVRTNGTGQAAAMNWMANDQVGRFEIHVNASYANQVGETTIPMFNATKVVHNEGAVASSTREKHGWFSPTWVKIAVIAGGAALVTGIVLATRGGGSAAAASTPPTITITPGPPTVGH
jgi:hypothetical protein